VLLVFGAPCQLKKLAGQEHGRTIPLADISRTFNDLFLNPHRGLSQYRFEPLRCLVLSLGAAMRRRDFVKAIIASAAGWPLIARAQQPTTPVSPVLGQPAIDAFMAEELFGIAHPDQLLAFSGVLNPATQKLMKGGSEVSYQVNGNKILIRAEGGVAANSVHTWMVASGARSASAQVTVTDGGTYYQMDNGLVAVRIPKTIAVGTPVLISEFNPDQRQRVYAPTQVLGPIQGIRHRDGTWTGTGPNYLYNAAHWYSTQLPPNDDWTHGVSNFPATAATVEVLENGPLRAKIKVSYVALRQCFVYGNWESNTPASVNGYFICTITLEAGQQSIIVDHETDCHPVWNVDMNTGVSADRARYRGHHAESIAQGHNYDGTIYISQDARADIDAEIILSDTGTRNNYDYTGGRTPWDGVWYPHLYRWYTWEPNTGWYWHAYNSAGGSGSNVWGIFQGRSSFYLNSGETQGGGIGMYGKPAAGTPTEHGFYVHLNLFIPLPDFLYRKGSFGIFLGSKGADVPVDFSAAFFPGLTDGIYSTYAPGIAKANNLHSGAAQFWKQIDQSLDFPDPPGGFNGMYLSRADTEALIAAIESDQGARSLYMRLYNQDSYYRRVWDAFADETNAKATELVQWCFDLTAQAVNVYVNLGEIHALWWAYWMGATRFQSIAVNTEAMLSLNQVRPFLTATQKRQLKAILSMTGHILWDDDFVPVTNWHGFHLGTANMPIQYGQARQQIAGLLKDHPQFSARFAGILDAVTSAFISSTDAYGAPRDSPHYAGALVIPTTDVFRQLQVGGYADVFAPTSSIYDRLTGLAEWTMQIMTPKQSRFGNLRKMVCYGDGTSEGHDHFLALIMGFEAHDLTLSKRMAGAWADMGQPMSSFYASSGMKIRPNFPTQDPALGDADFPGYMTVMRSGWGTANESAVFLSHGDTLTDHSTFQRGSPSIYLLGAPVCISFGTMYNPHVVGPWVSCSTYIPVREIGWSGGQQVPGDWSTYTDLNTPCGVHSDYFHDTYTYEPTTNQVDLTCTFSVSGWIRHLTYYRDVLSCPIVRLRDSNTAGESVFTLHMMATGAVTKPDGSTITPTTLTGTPFGIANGACFKFTGQWGVSWDLYYFGPTAQAFIGVYINTWATNAEAGQYLAATGNTFEEKQYILRIKSAGPCDTVLVPYPTGQRPANLNVVQVSGGLRVDSASRTLAN
jgi:hypothetical protein